MVNKIFLQEHRSKKSSPSSNALGVSLRNSKKLLPQYKFASNINLNELYNKERYDCSKIRLNCVVHPYCSNVLFNVFTEVVQNEGSESAVCLNLESDLVQNDFIQVHPVYKTVSDFASADKSDGNFIDLTNSYNSDKATLIYNLIDDTQLSSNLYGNLEYHCGLDFLNNHILRSNTFKTVTPLLNGKIDNVFNTMTDFHRHYDGTIISGDTVKVGDRDFSRNLQPFKNHIYEYEDLLTFKQCFDTKLDEKNGWFGFVNKGKLKMYDINNDKKLLDINKPLNNREACEFVDMYPSRDLFYFTPKYNKFRHRIEKNWNYCLTYPSSSTTENIPFLNNKVDGGALRLFLIDETNQNNMKMYSMSKHGLVEGDYIRLYRNDEQLINSLKVVKIINEYNFEVSKNGLSINSILEVSENNSVNTKVITSYKFKKDGMYFYDTNSNFLTFSFKKLVNGKGVDYYVRLFSRLPNWKFVDRQLNEKEIYYNDKDLIKKYQFITNNKETDFYPHGESEQFENHIGKLSLKKTIYNDDVGEVIYTDDIDINYLKDNLGRPLTSIYFTIIKNNKGFKEWYEESNDNKFKLGDKNVEFSHCFGKVTCGFYLNPMMYDVNFMDESGVNNYSLCNTHTICEGAESGNHDIERMGLSESFSGLNISVINDNEHYETNNEYGNLKDTINFYHNRNYYGDLCYYCHEIAEEVVIQDVDFRFNTYQREHWCNEMNLNYSNIRKDDYDANSLSDDFLTCKFHKFGNLHEGYYYKPHHEIKIRSIATELEEQSPKVFTIRHIDDDNKTVFTNENNFFEVGDFFKIYNKNSNNVLDATITEVLSFRKFKFEYLTENLDDEKLNFENQNKIEYLIIRPDSTIPNHAEFLRDGSCKYVWRYILQNGFDETNQSSVERYPFTNNRLYIMKDINLYLKRQNPDNSNILKNLLYDDFKIDGNFISHENKNNFYSEEKIQC